MRSRSIFLILSGTIALGAVGLVLTRDQGAAAGKTAAAPPEVPVVASTAIRRDVPIYLTGLGRVQALNTVIVRSQVDGQITATPFREGTDVRAGELLVQIDPEPYQARLDQATGKLEQDRLQLENTLKVLKRDSDLTGKGLLDRQSFETQQSSADQLAALVKIDAAAVSEARIQLAFTHITSPIAGRVGLRQADAGNLVHATDTTSLATVTQVQPIALVFTLPERDLRRINAALRDLPEHSALAVSAIDRDNREILDRGELLAVDNQIDVNSGTFKLKAVFQNSRRNLWPGQFVNARILVATLKKGLVVPAGAIQAGPHGDSTYVIGPDLKVEFRNVKVELSDAGVAVITSGLNEGDRVAVDGQLRLHPSDRVQIKEMAPIPD